MQTIWEWIEPTFSKTCPRKIRDCLKFNLYTTRVSVNLINKGLPPHLDSVIPKQPDPKRSIPGISISVHLGAQLDDSVFLQFTHETKLRALFPGMMAVFPGYALKHRTVRPPADPHKPDYDDPRRPRRYSLVLFFAFTPSHSQKIDKYIHESFQGMTSDTYPRVNRRAHV